MLGPQPCWEGPRGASGVCTEFSARWECVAHPCEPPKLALGELGAIPRAEMPKESAAYLAG